MEIRSYGYLHGSTNSVNPLYTHEAGHCYWYQNDHLGTPQQLTDDTGAIVWEARYTSFGKASFETEIIVSNFRLPGQYYDAETGLHYNGHRYYDPDTGRYLRTDPLGIEGGLNLYVYTLNNPLMFTDPDGMVARTVVDSGHNLNDQFNKQIVFPALDILSLPDKAIDWATKTTSDERMAWAASSPFPADDVILGSITCLGKLPKVARAITASKSIANEVPSTLARVVPGKRNITTLGRPGTKDVFVTAADDIAGLNAAQLSKRLTIDPSDTFTIIKFPTPSSGLATPINRLDKGFIGGGRTAGGAREFVLPNQPIPSGAIKEVVR